MIRRTSRSELFPLRRSPQLSKRARRNRHRSRPDRANYWRDLWRYRELFYFLAWRDILVRYKQTVNRDCLGIHPSVR